MKGNERKCVDCNVPMKKRFIQYRGVELEARECPKCKEKIFTEELTMKAISKLEGKRLEEEYTKNPIKIGHSWAMTFPAEVVKVFGLDKKRAKIKIHPDVEKGKIEISVG